MNTVKRIAKNTSYLLVSQILVYLFGFFYIVYAARYLGTLEFGILSFALAFTSMFGFFVDLGLASITTRDLSRDKSLTKKYVNNIIFLKILLGILTFVLIMSLITFLGYSYMIIQVVLFLAFYFILNSFSVFFYSVFQAYEKMEFQAIGQFLNAFLLLIGIFLGIYLNLDVLGFALIYFIVGFLIFNFNFVMFLNKFFLPKFKVDWNFWKSIVIQAIPFGLSGVFIVIYFSIDTVLLSIIKGDIAVGLYNAPYRLVYALLFIPTAYFSAIFPVMSRFFKDSEDKLKILYQNSFRYMLIFSIPIVIGTTVLAHNIILLIYGSEYIQSVFALQILIWGILCSYIAYAPTYSLYAINKQSIHAKIVLIGMILNIILNLIVIPEFSFIGASIATVFTEFCVMFLLLFYNKKLGNKLSIPKTFFLKVFLASVIIFIVILSLNTVTNIFFTITITAIIYLILIYLLGLLNNDDFLILKKIINI